MRNDDYEKQLKELQALKHQVMKSLCNAPEGTMRCVLKYTSILEKMIKWI